MVPPTPSLGACASRPPAPPPMHTGGSYLQVSKCVLAVRTQILHVHGYAYMVDYDKLAPRKSQTKYLRTEFSVASDIKGADIK